MITLLAPSPALDVTFYVPSIVVGASHRPREVLQLAGGKGLNLARAAAVLGAQVRVVAPLGGHIGRLIAEMARAEGLLIEAVPVAEEARICVTAVPDGDESSATAFYESAPELSAREWASLSRAFTASVSGSPSAGGWAVLTGSLPPDTSLEDLARTLLVRRALGDRIAVDVSGPTLASLVDAVAPDLVKVNRREAMELLGVADNSPLPELAARIRQRTGGIVVLTDGTAGAIALDAVGGTHAQPDPRPGPYRIGSGDSFLAGLLWAMEGNASLEIALRAASAAGSANASVPGAGVFDRAAFDAAFSRIQVESV